MLVTRVILDTDYARFASEEHLAALLDRGFRLSISMAVLQEIWANSVNNQKRGVLFTRAKTLSKYLDADMPITPIGLGLKRQVHPLLQVSRAAKDTARDNIAEYRELWNSVVNDGVNRASWLATGEAAEEEMANDSLVSQLNGIIGAHPDLRKYNERHAVAVLRRGLSERTRTQTINERCHAYASVFCLRIVRSAGAREKEFKKSSANDSQDAQLLMQVGLPAFVAMRDKRTLADVDASGTYQAPWIRTVEDLLTAELPTCSPWGPAAKKEARNFQRSSA
jgi:hypothetical protein